MLGTGGHEQYLVLRPQHAVDHPHQHHHADVVVEPGIGDQGLERRIRIAGWRRDAGNDGLQHILDALPGLGRTEHRVLGRNADDVLDFLDHPVRLGRGQVDLVQHRHHFHAQLNRRVAVGHGLRLDPLGGVDHQQGAFAGRQRAAHFIGEIDVARGIDQVELIGLAISRLVTQGCGLGLDGDAALPLQVHGIEHLGLHLAVGQAAAQVDDAIRQRGFAVVDVGDDGKVSGQLHQNNRRRPRRLPNL